MNASKPRGHETSRGRNHPDRSQEITTGTYKKPETYQKQARAHSSGTADAQPGTTNTNPWNDDIRDEPTNSGSTRAREESLHGRSGSDSNADPGTRGH